MEESAFIDFLVTLCTQLTTEAQEEGFSSARDFEQRVRVITHNFVRTFNIPVSLYPPAQSFPDIAAGAFGIEVKFTTNDTWLSIANSVMETNRAAGVEHIFVVFCKMGGVPEVRWERYEECVTHVRTSHVPRFEIEVTPHKSSPPLFKQMGISYDNFRTLPMHSKMQHIREYARGRLKPGERLWWLEDPTEPKHVLPIQVRLYTQLTPSEKRTLRAECVLLCPKIVQSGRSRDKYFDAVLYLLTIHGVLCHQARDLFSAGSVANPGNDDFGGVYIERSIKLIENDIIEAAHRLDDELFVEYWGLSVKQELRIAKWLSMADALARGWTPSRSLFIEYQKERIRRVRDSHSDPM